jgi:hypothetical protein
VPSALAYPKVDFFKLGMKSNESDRLTLVLLDVDSLPTMSMERSTGLAAMH